MKKEFIVEKSGKSFVLYTGLLDAAHDQGLISITTELVQIPTEANQITAICTAKVVLEKDGITRTFTGVGDASPQNVAPPMRNCLIRMAETRSKARALRDAVNIDLTLDDEGNEEELPVRTSTTRPPYDAPSPRPAPPVAAETEQYDGGISDSQVRAIRSICKQYELMLPDMQGMSEIRAAQEINRLNKQVHDAKKMAY